MIKGDNNSCIHPVGSEEEEDLESTKAKVGQVREENERLKLLLSKTLNDYNSLQTHVFDLLRQDQEASGRPSLEPSLRHHVHTSLCLGRSDSKKGKGKEEKESCRSVEKLELGLRFGFNDPKPDDESTKNDLRDGNEVRISWSREDIKTKRSQDEGEEKGFEQHQQQEPGLKKPRVCVRATCEGPTMNDGCQWRKYGQKTAKGNPLPRAYYRCTMSPNCPVRKQVQRSSEDASILIMTYEGNHDHPLPTAATAVAAATSAAASILQCHHHSSTSLDDAGPSHFFPSRNLSISTSNAHPTITLDLAPPTNYDMKLPNYPHSSSSSSTSLSFSSFDPTPRHPQSNILSFNGFTTNRQASFSTTDALTRLITWNSSLRTALADALDSRLGRNTSSSFTTLPFSSPFSSSVSKKEHDK